MEILVDTLQCREDNRAVFLAHRESNKEANTCRVCQGRFLGT